MTPSPSKPQSACYRLLIVDDNPAIHEDFRKILKPPRPAGKRAQDLEAILFGGESKNEGEVTFELDSAHQGQEALEMLKQSQRINQPYSLAFVDVRMPPGWDGIETISHLWKVDPRLQIVICTAYSDYSWDEMRAKLGQPDSLVVLKKPFDNIEVQQLAHALTRKWELNLQAEVKMEQLETMVQQRTDALYKANQELARSEERFAKAFHTSPVAMAIQSLPDQKFVDVNERMLLLTGCPREDIIGSSAPNLFIWEAPKTMDEWIAAAVRNKNINDLEAKMRDQKDNLHEVRVSMSMVDLSGTPHLLLLIQDVTERNTLERQFHQAQKMEAIGQLAAGVAHDFNNILTIIQGYAGLLKFHISSGRSPTEAVDIIMQAATRASGLIRQLLMFSRKQVMQFRHLDLNETIRNSMTMVGRLVGEHISIEFVNAKSLPVIHADPTMLEQIIMNLAVNARDAMSNGGKITIATEAISVSRDSIPSDPEARAGQYVRLTFKDTGCGMEPDILNRIFEPFFTTKDVGKGTGLGLSTVFGIVRQHDGWIEVTSQPGKGTAFQMYFPAKSDAIQQNQRTQDTTFLMRGTETILLAEDEPELREMISLGLQSQGYNVISASTGVEALSLYERTKRPIDLLLTDMVMPGGILGNELAERMRSENPKIKVIFTSGYSPGMAGKDLSLIEGRNFLPKPFSVGKLARMIRDVMDQKSVAN